MSNPISPQPFTTEEAATITPPPNIDNNNTVMENNAEPNDESFKKLKRKLKEMQEVGIKKT